MRLYIYIYIKKISLHGDVAKMEHAEKTNC